MQNTPKSLRLQIAITGRTNAGKSSFLNLIAGQSVSITSPEAGTTTDVVEKAMELFPIGPVLFLDSAGLDDRSTLGQLRMDATWRLFSRADVVLLLCDGGQWGDPEEKILAEAKKSNLPCIVVFNKTDLNPPEESQLAHLREVTGNPVILCNSADQSKRDAVLNALKGALLSCLPEDFVTPPPLLEDLVKSGDVAVMLIPVDIQAPKGRLILPQVQVLRDALDQGAIPLVTKENQFVEAMTLLKQPPALIVCDSQVVDFMVKNIPPEQPCTTFSILFSRLKADLRLMAQGALAIGKLHDGDTVMIAEACTHHAADDDIGRVKIPRLLQKKTGLKLNFEVVSGRDFPQDLSRYQLIIHCGSCMLTRRETLSRLSSAAMHNIPITNYGMAISYCQGVLERVLAPFKLQGNNVRRLRND